jgi:DNA repair exonuclease SbcCD ATPase subunit
MDIIKFQKVHLENCGCHHEIDIDFVEKTLTAITGKNGKGKSTIFNSMVIGLFGDTGEATGPSLRVSDLLNRKSPKNLLINIFFLVNDDKYEIRKYQKHSQHSNKTILLKNDNDISGKSVTETHKKIESILVSKGVFRNTVYFGQQIKDFFTALTNSEQKLIFNAIFAFEEWLERYKFTDSQLKLAIQKLDSFKIERIKITNQIPEKKMYLALLLKTKKEKEEVLKQRGFDLDEDINKLKGDIVNLNNEKEHIKYDPVPHDEMKTEITKLEVEQTNTKEDSEKKTEFTVSQCNSNVEMLKVQAKQEYTENSVNISNKYNEEIEKLTGEENQNNDDISNLRLEAASDILSLVEASNKIISKHEGECNKLNNILTQELRKVDQIVTTGAEIESKVHELDKESFKTKEQPEIDCTKCGQPLGIVERDKVIKDIGLEQDICRNELTKLREEGKTLQTEVSESQSKLDKVQKKADKEKKSCSTKVKVIEQKRDEKISSISEKQINITTQLEDLNTKKDAEILVSKSQVEKDYKQKINEQIVNKDNSVKEIQISLEKRENVLYNTLNELQDKCSVFDEQLKQINTISGTLSVKQHLIKTKDEELVELKSQPVVDDSEIHTVGNTIKELVKQEKNLKKDEDHFNELITILEFWKEGFSDRGIKSMLIDDALPYLNECVREELERLAPGRFILTFDTLSTTGAGDIRDKFSVNVLNTETGADNYKLLSGGEKRMIDVCTISSLRKLTEKLHGKSFNIFLLDEVLDSLDSDNSVAYLKILKKISDDLSVTLVTHSKECAAYCDRVFQL